LLEVREHGSAARSHLPSEMARHAREMRKTKRAQMRARLGHSFMKTPHVNMLESGKPFLKMAGDWLKSSHQG
jgi:hypothetical protein